MGAQAVGPGGTASKSRPDALLETNGTGATLGGVIQVEPSAEE